MWVAKKQKENVPSRTVRRITIPHLFFYPYFVPNGTSFALCSVPSALCPWQLFYIQSLNKINQFKTQTGKMLLLPTQFKIE
jgi:hypothetical protein